MLGPSNEFAGPLGVLVSTLWFCHSRTRGVRITSFGEPERRDSDPGTLRMAFGLLIRRIVDMSGLGVVILILLSLVLVLSSLLRLRLRLRLLLREFSALSCSDMASSSPASLSKSVDSIELLEMRWSIFSAMPILSWERRAS